MVLCEFPVWGQCVVMAVRNVDELGIVSVVAFIHKGPREVLSSGLDVVT